MARPTRSCSIIPARSFATVSLRTGSSGRSTRTACGKSDHLARRARTRPACSIVRSVGACAVGGEACRHCGFLPKRPPHDVSSLAGELACKRAAVFGATSTIPIRGIFWLGMFAHIARERGYKPGWAAHKFKEKFGTWPPWGSSPQPIPPTPEVVWVRSRAIAFAKARAK